MGPYGERFASIGGMSDEDFGTINLRRGERAREIEVLRQHYRQHREALARMQADAPTEHLASEYQRLITEIDRALGKLNELEGGAAAAPPPPPPRTEPGLRPLVTSPIADEVEDDDERSMRTEPPMTEEPRSRVPLILAAAVIALAAIGWLIWKASNDRGATPAIVAEDTAAPTSTAPDTVVEQPAAPAAGLAANPPAHDYGVIRKGTRATHRFEIANNSDEPVTIDVARSACRCLYYDYDALIPPRAKQTLTVTVDGAKAKAGALQENVKVSAKSDPAVATTVQLSATIQ